MEPAHPPLPTASYLRFQFVSGIQISTLMSESGVGFSVAATRQNGGSSLSAAVRALAEGSPGPGRKPSGGVNSPAATDCASVMAASGRANLASASQEDGAAFATSGRNNTTESDLAVIVVFGIRNLFFRLVIWLVARRRIARRAQKQLGPVGKREFAAVSAVGGIFGLIAFHDDLASHRKRVLGESAPE